jgi:1,4-dihydroxy-2-naphthoate octaprenyltransferase
VLIAINNLRDRVEDAQSNKRTLAVRFGECFAKWEIAACCLAPYLLGLGWSRFGLGLGGWPAGGAVGLGLLVAWLVQATPPGRVYNKFLALSALHLVVWTGWMTWALVRSKG